MKGEAFRFLLPCAGGRQTEIGSADLKHDCVGARDTVPLFRRQIFPVRLPVPVAFEIAARARKRGVRVLLFAHRVIGGVEDRDASLFKTAFRDLDLEETHLLPFLFVFFAPVFPVHPDAVRQIGAEIIAAKPAHALRVFVLPDVFEQALRRPFREVGPFPEVRSVHDGEHILGRQDHAVKTVPAVFQRLDKGLAQAHEAAVPRLERVPLFQGLAVMINDHGILSLNLN